MKSWNYHGILYMDLICNITRDGFPAVNIYKEWSPRIFNFWTKSHSSNFWDGITHVPLVRKTSAGGFFQRNLRWLFPKEIHRITESVKTKKSCVSWKIFEIEFKFLKFSSIRSKALCLDISEPIKRLAAQSTACALRNYSW